MSDLVYILEDDENIRELMEYTLTSSGFEVMGFETSDQFMKQLEKRKPAIALLDIMLPMPSPLSGTEILKRMKGNEEYKHIPVIFVTAKSQEIEKAQGLDMGADDYIAKPFGVLELIARVKAVLRRAGGDTPPKDEEIYEYMDLTINLKSKEILQNGQPVKFTFKEFELLLYLYLNRGIVVSRDQLLEKVWGEEYYGETRTVDVHIRSIRQKLGDSAENSRYISTIRGFGYKMNKMD